MRSGVRYANGRRSWRPLKARDDPVTDRIVFIVTRSVIPSTQKGDDMEHNDRMVHCPCDRCAKRRAMSAAITNPLVFNFNATELGKFLDMAISYRKGELD